MYPGGTEQYGCRLTHQDDFCHLRQRSEAFIAGVFAEHYGATIAHYMPYLLALESDSNSIFAASGLSPATGGQLYLEKYLNAPIEGCLADSVGSPVHRSGLMEIGNFAAGSRGGARQLIQNLVLMLKQAGYDWAVFTIGPLLKNTFTRMHIDLVDLCSADPGALSIDEQARWGSYYAQKPRVMAASVSQAFQAVCDLPLAATDTPMLPRPAIAAMLEVA